jgi:predicted membrane protein
MIVLMDFSARNRNMIAFFSSMLLLLQVFAMRWNVVIGGQMFSKSMSGFREAYVPEMFAKEGILAAALILFIPFVLLVIFEKVLPTFRHLET